jgi:hypothetical protein
MSIPLLASVIIIVGLAFRRNFSSRYKVALIFCYLFIELNSIIFLPVSPLLLLILVAGTAITIWNLEKLDSNLSFDRMITIIGDYISFEKAVFVTCIAFVVFMPVTGDYYLLIMFLPLLLFPRAQYSLGYFLAFGLLLGAKNIGYFPEPVGANPLSLQPFINPLLLLLMLFAEFDIIPFMRRTSYSTEQPIN